MKSMSMGVKVDADFPGGNILVTAADADGAVLAPDLRDTEGHWFYWCFRVRGAAGRKLYFKINPAVIGVRGPAFSLDQGASWRWLGEETVAEDGFSFQFPGSADEVRFSFGMPYLQAHLQRFLKRTPSVTLDGLCQSAQGRSVELLYWGCRDVNPSARIVFTARHHACEMMANYVLEGILQESLSDSPVGHWLRTHVAMAAIPFVDKDGVEDGDQGKNRRPHDHGRDYGEAGSRYPEPRALRAWAKAWFDGCPAVALDLHCPGRRGHFHERVMFPCRVRSPGNWQRMRPFLRRLEQATVNTLPFNLAENEAFETWDGRPYKPPVPLRGYAEWAETLPGMQFAAPLETPYANASGMPVDAESARGLGRALATALAGYLQDMRRAP